MSDSFEDQLIKEFEQGKLPAAFLDKERIVDPNDPVAREFSTYMEGIAKKLIGKDYDPQQHQLRFLLSASDEPNAFIVSAGKPPAVAFTKGLLKILATEDQVAAVLGHELEHENLYKRFGAHMNSGMEETGADVGSMFALARAGYQPQAMKEALALLPLPTKDLFTRIASAADPHPEMHTRIRSVEDAQVWLERNKGRSKALPTALAADLHEKLTTVERPSDLSLKLNGMGFQQASPAKKIELVAEVLHPEIVGLDEYNDDRIKEVKALIENLEINKNDPAQMQSLETLMDQLVLKPKTGPGLSSWKSGNELLQAIEKAWDKTNGTQSALRDHPLHKKRLLEAKQVFESFIHASTPVDMEKYGAQVNDLATRFDFKHSPLIPNSLLAAFSLPTTDELAEVQTQILEAPKEQYAHLIETLGIKPSWEQHLNIALESDSRAIMEALQHCGVEDPRLPIRKSATEVITTPGTPTHIDPLKLSQVYVSPSGKIFAERPYPSRGVASNPALSDDPVQSKKWADVDMQFSQRSEKKRLEGMDAIQKAVLPTVDWQELGHDFWGFIHKYKNYIRPEISVVDGGDVFARAFMDHCNDLVKKDPTTFKPLLYEFITGRPQGAPVDYNYTKDPEQYPPHHHFFTLRNESKARAKLIGADVKREFSEFLPRGISMNHPFVRMLVDDPHQVFLPVDKANVLSMTRFLDVGDNPHTPADKIVDPAKWLEPPRKLLGHNAPETVQDLNALYLKHAPSTEAEIRTAHLPDDREGFFFIENVIAMEAAALLSQPDIRVTREELRFLRECNKEGLLDGGPTPKESAGRDRNAAPQPKKAGKLTELADQLRQRELEPSTSAHETLDGYFYLANTEWNQPFLKDPELRKRYEDKIRHDIDSTQDTHVKLDLLQQLIYSRKLPSMGLKDGPVALFPHTYEPDLTSPEFRKWALNNLVKAQVKILGKDDGSKEYYKLLKAVVDDIGDHTSGVVRYQLLEAITDRVDAQRQISYDAHSKVMDIDLNRILEYHMKTAVTELGIEKIGDNPELAQQTVEFFRKPPTAGNIEHYKQQVETALAGGNSWQWGDLTDEQKTDVLYNQHRSFWQLPFEGRSLYLSRVLFPSQEGDQNSLEVQVNRLVDQVFDQLEMYGKKNDAKDAIKRVLKEKTGKEYTIEYQDDRWKDTREELKRNLTAALNEAYPNDADKLGELFKAIREPAIKLDDDNPLNTYKRPLTFADKKANILNEIFPAGKSYSEEGRVLVESYLNVSDIPHQRLLLSAMMVSNEPSVDPATGHMRVMRVGEALNFVLSSMGPAGRKLLQAIHSHPNTPQEIKDDIKHAKTMSSKLARWALHKRLEEVGPKAATPDEAIVHVHETLGAGAYGVVPAVTKQNGDQTAVTLLHENVRPQAEFEFDNYLRAAQLLVQEYPHMSSVLDMIKQASKMSAIETDMDLAEKQHRIAEKLYDNLTIEVDGHKFHFYAAKLVGIGPEYKETKIVPGSHFNDLLTADEAAEFAKQDQDKYEKWAASNAPVEENYKKAAAKALLTAEFLTLAKGKHADHDRHGGQQRILHGSGGAHILNKGGHSFVGQFDFGAISPRAPSLADKKALVKVLINAYRDSTKRNAPTFFEALSQQIEQQAGNEKTRDYLNGFKRGLLALGDIAKPLDSNDMKDVAMAVVKNMNIDRVFVTEVIRNARFSDVPRLFSLVKNTMSGTARDGEIRIKEDDTTIPPLPKGVVSGGMNRAKGVSLSPDHGTDQSTYSHVGALTPHRADNSSRLHPKPVLHENRASAFKPDKALSRAPSDAQSSWEVRTIPPDLPPEESMQR